jgi:hypothetical protein
VKRSPLITAAVIAALLVPQTALAVPPETTINGPGRLIPTRDNTPTFTIGSSDPAATFECLLDYPTAMVDFLACPSTYTTPSLADGTHSLQARARNSMGEVDPMPARMFFQVDSTPPQISLLDPKSLKRTRDRTPTFLIEIVESGISPTCSIDRRPWTPCRDRPLAPNPPPSGQPVQETIAFSAGKLRPRRKPHRLRVLAFDLPGNQATIDFRFRVLPPKRAR